jgi:hypothetical protein
MLDEEESEIEDDIASRLDIEEDHIGEIEEQLIQSQHSHGTDLDPVDQMLLRNETTFEPIVYGDFCPEQMDETVLNSHFESFSNAGGLCYDQSSISDRIDQMASGH